MKSADVQRYAVPNWLAMATALYWAVVGVGYVVAVAILCWRLVLG
jgi:hypothetical protein